jgi:long-chain acyl-CoA synthetase
MTTTTGPTVNLAARLEHRSDRVALHLDGRAVTHAELAERVARWRGGMAGAGVGDGVRVAIVAANGEAVVAAHLAVLGLGAVSVPLNPQCPPPELARDLAAARVGAVVADEVGRGPLAAALDHPAAAGLDPIRLDPADLERAEPAPLVGVAADQAAVLLFTSGTSGPPRPAVLTHGNLTSALEAVLSLPTGLVDRPQTFLAVVPMFHVLGLNAVLHLALLLGGSLVLGEYQGAAATIEAIERHRVTVALGPPNLWHALAAVPDADPDRVSSIELALSGADSLPASVKVAVAERLGLRLDEGYGLTESAAVVASTVSTTAPPGSVGRLVPGVEARIVDEAGDDCLAGDPGQLLVRGSMVFPGFWTPDGLDRAAVGPDGWLDTGDLAVVDENGFLAIVGRTKDLIIVSGFNVYPGEVEAVLADHPDVADVGVVGEPSASTGESIVAFVVPAAGRSIDEDELASHCRAELARYKVPSRFVVAPQLPIGPTGKLQRSRLR